MKKMDWIRVLGSEKTNFEKTKKTENETNNKNTRVVGSFLFYG